MVKTETKNSKAETIIDDLQSSELDMDKLAFLKAKLKDKEKMAAKIVAKKERTINIGVIGLGQAGSRLSEIFYKLGYNAVAINTAMQDLKHIDIPDTNKLYIQYGIGGGAGKDLAIGEAAAVSNADAITDIVGSKLSDAQVFLVASSLGGGSGAGSLPVVIEMLRQYGNPIVVMVALPMESEDAKSKSNSLQTLAKLATLTQNKSISNLIVVDNARIEAIHSNVGQLEFFNVANRSIVEVLDIFNTLSSEPSLVKPLDDKEWSKLLLDGEALSTYGSFNVTDYTDELALADGVMNSLDNNLLASGFDIKGAKYVGIMYVGSEEVMSKIPKSASNYAKQVLIEKCSAETFEGIYVVPSKDDFVKVYTFFSGLNLPTVRVNELKEEVSKYNVVVQTKSDSRVSNLNIDLGKSDGVSASQKLKDKLAARSSTFGKFVTGVVDRRK